MMEEKKLCILVTFEGETAHVQIESTEINEDELKMMGFAAVSCLAEAVEEKIQDPESRDKFFNALINKLTDLRDKETKE